MMVNERVGFGVTIAQAIEAVDETLLPIDERVELNAERQAQQNLQGAQQLGLKIVGLPGAGG
jgi:hypothetical protein